MQKAAFCKDTKLDNYFERVLFGFNKKQTKSTAPSMDCALSAERGFNREAFGEYTDSLFAMRLPLDAVRSGDVTETMRRHIETIGGVEYIQVHPTFLYESVWCAVLLIILVLYRKHKKYEGELFLLYVFGYALGRVWIEGLRTDQLLLPGVGLPVSQLLAGIIVLAAGAALLYLRKHHKKMPMLKSGKVYEPMPDKIEGKKPPKKKDKIFQFRDK